MESLPTQAHSISQYQNSRECRAPDYHDALSVDAIRTRIHPFKQQEEAQREQLEFLNDYPEPSYYSSIEVTVQDLIEMFDGTLDLSKGV